MTAKQVYESVLIEINKLGAPSLLLEDYNYFVKKAVQQYINKVYNHYDINQQSTDDLKVLTRHISIELQPNTVSNFSKRYVGNLPDNYLHLLNCVVEYESQGTKPCTTKGTSIYYGARRATADMLGQIINNAYMKPTIKRPYYYINNFSNSSNSSIEILCGDKVDYYEPNNVHIDYIKKPENITLSYTEIEGISKSAELEFPEYVCYEIINDTVKLVLENASDPRLQTNLPINQTIATGVPITK